MCKFPRYIVNPHYKKFPLDLDAQDVLPYDYFCLIKCGRCSQCRKTRLSNWTFRILNEIKYGERDDPDYHAEFVTLTLSPRYYDTFRDDPSRPIRLFLERYRSRYGKTLRHFFVTELGDEKGRLHFHGVIFNSAFKISKESFKRRQLKASGKGKYGKFINNDGMVKKYNSWLRGLWKYGNTWVDVVRPETSFYVVKYIGKPSKHDDTFVSSTFVSPGLGIKFCEDEAVCRSVLQQDTPLYMMNENLLCIPSYYIRKIFGDERIRAKMYSNFLDPPLPSSYFDGIPVRDWDDWRNKVADYSREFPDHPRLYAAIPPSYLLQCSDERYQHAINNIVYNVNFLNSLN